MYAHLDYDIQGWTFGKGAVYIILTLLTPDAVTHENALRSIAVGAVDENELAMYIQQIGLENGRYMDIGSKRKLYNELARLDLAPWSDLDSLKVLNLQDVHHQSDILTESQERYHRSYFIVTVSTEEPSLSSARPELAVLFHQLSWLFMHNYIARLCSKTHVYSARDDFIDMGETAMLKNVFYSDISKLDFSQCVAEIKDVSSCVAQSDVLEEFIHQLRENSYNRADLTCPDDTRIYQETGIFIGREGWRQIATIDNVEKLIKGMCVELKVKNKHSSFCVR